ncbi:MAG: XdhC/CoxI family protein, partial [Gemmatimonadetes bacterium]
MSEAAGVLATACEWMRAGRGVVLGTVASTWGSAPRPAGSHIVVAEDGAFTGSVSGGCVEGAVVQAARAMPAGAPPRLMDFGVSDAEAWSMGLACGGRIEVLLERGPEAGGLRAVVAALAARRPLTRAVRLRDGRAECFDRGGVEGPEAIPGTSAAVTGAAGSETHRAEIDGESWLLRPYEPPVRVVLVGAVHVAQALAAVLAPLGFDVLVVDPRGAFATAERFPGVRLVQRWPGDVLGVRHLSVSRDGGDVEQR